MEQAAQAGPGAGMHSGRLRAIVIPATAVDDVTKGNMFELFARYYADVSMDAFTSDLGKKNHVIVVYDTGDGTLQGFTTVQVLDRTIGGRRMLAIFSGDTIVSQEYWGQMTIQMAFLKYLLALKLKHPILPLYWFLISKGYKTYLLLTRNVLQYWPRHDAPTPVWEASAIAALVQEKYPEAWVPERGILHFEQCPGKLLETVAPITDDLLQFPDIRFFAQKNPGHNEGDELCCLGLIDGRQVAASLWKYGLRSVMRRGRRS